ncbi:hypothetical protein RKD18_007896 [Streptomyces phaeoluteigriseus]
MCALSRSVSSTVPAGPAGWTWSAWSRGSRPRRSVTVTLSWAMPPTASRWSAAVRTGTTSLPSATAAVTGVLPRGTGVSGRPPQLRWPPAPPSARRGRPPRQQRLCAWSFHAGDRVRDHAAAADAAFAVGNLRAPTTTARGGPPTSAPSPLATSSRSGRVGGAGRRSGQSMSPAGGGTRCRGGCFARGAARKNAAETDATPPNTRVPRCHRQRAGRCRRCRRTRPRPDTRLLSPSGSRSPGGGGARFAGVLRRGRLGALGRAR